MIIYGIYDNDNHDMAMVMQDGALKMGIYIYIYNVQPYLGCIVSYCLLSSPVCPPYPCSTQKKTFPLVGLILIISSWHSYVIQCSNPWMGYSKKGYIDVSYYIIS